VFGHLEPHMPASDVAFAKGVLQWVDDNVEVLRPARVCIENDDACVVSKIRDGKGPIYLLNYSAGHRTFVLRLHIDTKGDLEIKQVYPDPKDLGRARDGDSVEVTVRGEGLAILDVNSGLTSPPPQNPGAFPLDLDEWRKCENGIMTTFAIPDIRAALSAARDGSVPEKILSLDQVQHDDPALLDAAVLDPGREPVAYIDWVGRGKLPEEYTEWYGFEDDAKTVETWKLAPWAFADCVWLVYRPAPGQWCCPLFYADITAACKYGEGNTVVVSGLQEESTGDWYVMSVADRSLLRSSRDRPAEQR
jgi:hypothetical protein